MTDPAIASFGIFTAVTTTRGFTGHEMVDPVGLVHMNGRVYDPETGRFLSADPFVQDLGNLQSLNRYSYVFNNPLSYTDPSGFISLKSFLRAVLLGGFSLFKPVESVLKKALSNPIVRAVVQIAACASIAVSGPAGAAACAGVSAWVTMAAGGSVVDGLKAFAFSFATMGIFDAVGPTMKALQTAYGAVGHVMKAGVHGIIGGALSVAQGGTFLQGFVSSAAGSLGGSIAGESGLFGKYGDRNPVNELNRALVSGAAGCGGALITGGKCGEAAVTAAFASLYNGDYGRRIGAVVGGAIGYIADGPDGALIGAVTGARIGDKIEDRLLAAGVTTGALLSSDGDFMMFASPRAGGGPADPRFKNYPIASHVEGKAAIYMRDNEISSAILFINNPDGICRRCMNQVETLLPPGATLRVVPPPNAKSRNGSYPHPKTFTGNANVPKSPR